MQKDVSLPLWISFSDRNLFKNRNKITFYLVALESIVRFWKELSFSFDNVEDFNEIKVLRIPNELLIKSERSISLEAGQYKINQKLLNDFSKSNFTHNEKIKEELCLFIKKNEKYPKSKIAKKLSKDKLPFCFKEEINYHLSKLIADPEMCFRI